MIRYEYYTSSADRLLQLVELVNDAEFDYCDREVFYTYQDEDGLCTAEQCNACLKKWLMEEMPEQLPLETVIQRLEEFRDVSWRSYLAVPADMDPELSRDLQLDYKALTQAISWLKEGEPQWNRS